MISLKNTTFIIPVQIESADREFNFSHNIQFLCNNFETNIIIGESDATSKVEALLKQIDKKQTSILHVFEKTDSSVFHRTKLLNQMLFSVTTPITVNYDIDVFMHPDAYVDAVNKIINEHYDLVYPYLKGESQIQIFEAGKNELMAGKHFEDVTHKKTISICGHCQFFNTASYRNGGMENEGFVSYGIEDVERMHRFINLGFKVCWLDHYIYHIEHSRGHNSTLNNPHFKANDALWASLQAMDAEQLKQYYLNQDYLKNYWQHLHFMCYADGKYGPAQQMLLLQARQTNVFEFIHPLNETWINKDYYQKHKYILDHKKGYCLWKPYLMLDILNKYMRDGDILLYVDSADVFTGDAIQMRKTIENVMKKTDLFFTSGSFKNSDYTKRDCFVFMDCDTPEYHNAIQLENGIIVCKKTPATINFIKEWLHYCEIPAVITDDANVSGKPNLPGFIEHRWNQSIMTNLAIKYGIYQSHEMRPFITCNVNDPK